MYTSHLSNACGFVWGGFDASGESCRVVCAVGLGRPVGGEEGENATVNLGTYVEPSGMTCVNGP